MHGCFPSPHQKVIAANDRLQKLMCDISTSMTGLVVHVHVFGGLQLSTTTTTITCVGVVTGTMHTGAWASGLEIT